MDNPKSHNFGLHYLELLLLYTYNCAAVGEKRDHE